MPEEPKITMTEFKTVIEDFKSEQKKISEYMLHLNNKMDNGFQEVQKELGYLKGKSDSLSEQVALLHEGHTEIKSMLKQKVDRDEFDKLEKRVARLETKVA
jgi:hypothetical protein